MRKTERERERIWRFLEIEVADEMRKVSGVKLMSEI